MNKTGFLKGRFIGENIRLIDATINYTSFKNIPGLLLFLDFEKAFDTVEWSFIQKTFRQFKTSARPLPTGLKSFIIARKAVF